MNIESIIAKIESRQRLSRDEAHYLYEHCDLTTLGALANDVAREKHAGDIGYIIDRNINYTNVCALSCEFCNFYRKKSDDDAYTLSFEELDRKITETIAAGGTGILMQGGHHPDYKIDWYEDYFRHIRETFPQLHLHALSPPEIKHIANISRLSLEETIIRLKYAGLMSIPGGGGEILVDRVRREISAGKVSADEWLEIVAIAHRHGLPSSATMMFGHVETIDERFEHLERVRQTQDETGGFYAFIPWNFQGDDTELAAKREIAPVSGAEYLRLLAISRLFLDNIKNIQVSWLTQGLKLAAVALSFGANDMGSVMIEENVISQAGAHNSADAAALSHLISTAGFRPRQRNTCYEFLRDLPADAA